MAELDNLLVESNRLRNAPTELPDSKIAKTEYTTTTPQTAFVGTSQQNGARVEFLFSVGTGWRFVPARTFLEIRDTITYNAAQPTDVTGIAPAYFEPACLFYSMELQLDNDSVGRPIRDHYPQIAAFKMRSQKSGSYQKLLAKEGMGAEPDFAKRLQDIIADGSFQKPACYRKALTGTVTATAADGAVVGAGTAFTTELVVGDRFRTTTAGGVVIEGRVIEITDATNLILDTVTVDSGAGRPAEVFSCAKTTQRSHQTTRIHIPALSAFSDDSLLLPPGTYRLICTTQNNLAKACVEALEDKTVGAAALGYTVDNMLLHVAMIEVTPDKDEKGAPVQETKWQIMLNEVEYHDDILRDGDQTSVFRVNPQTDKITVALQSQRAASNNLYSPTRFITGGFEERKLSALSVTYNNQQKTRPQRILSPVTSAAFGSGGLGWRLPFVDSQLQNNMGSSRDGGESYQDWLDLGPIHCFQFQKGRGQLATDLIVNKNGTSTVATYPANLVVFAEHPLVLNISTTSTGTKLIEPLRVL